MAMISSSRRIFSRWASSMDIICPWNLASCSRAANQSSDHLPYSTPTVVVVRRSCAGPFHTHKQRKRHTL
eukprot:scaffold3973_cov161-Amphora_coffeaeformis.AAC.11